MHFNFFTGLNCLLTVILLVISSPVPAPDELEPDLAEVKKHLQALQKTTLCSTQGRKDKVALPKNPRIGEIPRTMATKS